MFPLRLMRFEIDLFDDLAVLTHYVARVSSAATSPMRMLISAAWTFQRANPSRSVLAALITTGKIGREKDLSFPGRVPGLLNISCSQGIHRHPDGVPAAPGIIGPFRRRPEENPCVVGAHAPGVDDVKESSEGVVRIDRCSGVSFESLCGRHDRLLLICII